MISKRTFKGILAGCVPLAMACAGAPFAVAGEADAIPTPDGYAALVEYAVPLALEQSGDAKLRAAVLAQPSALDGKRRDCDNRRLAVVLDLDPAGTLLDPAAPLSASTRLADQLSYLRASGITLAWLSGMPREAEPQLRDALSRTALDPQGEDTMLLTRNPDDRKQALRADFAGFHCLIAIAGDEPADFDELYSYLKDPADAAALDAVFGAGWFLAPPPLAPAEERL